MSDEHNWLNLIEVSGPFIAAPILRDVFPQGLPSLQPGRPQRLRKTYEEWRDAVDIGDIDLPALHRAWVDEVLVTALEIDDGVLRRDASLSKQLTVSIPEHGTEISPDLAVVNPTNSDSPLLLFHVYDPDTDLGATQRFDGLVITPADRMVSLLRGSGVPIGIVTNGERWMLVHAPVGAVASFASWYARLWGQEPETLRAFVSLLGIRRLFGPDEEKIPALYERSLKHQDEVTDALGDQVRRAVEVLVQALDRADQDHNRELLQDVEPRELYEAGLTVMMRLVFLLAAEERGLLLLGDPRYDSFYAISSLRMQLRADSEEILERRRSAWSRLLALFRAVYGGIDHPTLHLPALGGSLFDPDRYPFLEGRKKGTTWRVEQAEPLPIDDRTVLLLLEAIQTFEGRALSYRALDVEQIGHVYEGLLERTVKRVDDITLDLESSIRANKTRVTLSELETASLDGTTKIVELLQERSERSESAIRNALQKTHDDRIAARLLTVCRGDASLRDRILPYAFLLRADPWGYPLIYHKGAFVVVLGSDRRESGTHYTPKSLTEKIVEETLTPVAYRGPAEGKPREQWTLRSPEELLDLKICDPAMGSGAFLVQVCRWLSDRLVEAWSISEAGGEKIDSDGFCENSEGGIGFEPLSQDPAERAIVAKRLVAERCLYGVDINPLAVELAKLSIWLTTMSKGRPFGFLDHNLRSGDSLLGIHDIRQLTELSMAPKESKQFRLFGRSIKAAVNKAIELRIRLRSIPIRDIGDVDTVAALDVESRRSLLLPQAVADAFVGIILAEARATDRISRMQALEALADAAANGTESAMDRLHQDAMTDLAIDAHDGKTRDPFHWPLEFPEVFNSGRCGFDAFVGNPPFMGGWQLPTRLGPSYSAALKSIFEDSKGAADIVAYFFRSAFALLSKNGVLGLIATKSISETSTRAVGLDPILSNGGVIFSTNPLLRWQGTASVFVAILHISKGEWRGQRKINGELVAYINSSLTNEVDHQELYRLKNGIPYSQGVMLYGNSFIIEATQLEALIKQNPGLKRYIRRYVNGDVLNGTPNIDGGLYVIDFGESDEADISGCDLVLSHLKTMVMEERKNQTRQIHESRPWLHWDKRTSFLASARQKRRIIACVIVQRYVIFEFVDPNHLYSHGIKLFSDERASVLGCLQSSLHEAWVRSASSKLGNSIRYSTSTSFDTFPFSSDVLDDTNLSKVAEKYTTFRRQAALQMHIGLTELYNRFHDASNSDAVIKEFRDLHITLDKVTLHAYGWSDIDLDHSFREVPHAGGDRKWFTISDGARAEVLKRLSKLNKLRHEEEVRNSRAVISTKSNNTNRSKIHTALKQAELRFEGTTSKKMVPSADPNSAMEKIALHLETYRSWQSKSDILASINIPDGKWNAAISILLARGTIERKGERRSALYRISESD